MSLKQKPIGAASLILEALAARGIDAIFGVPGGQTLGLYHALERAGNTSIRHITMLDERSAAYAADAFARISGKVGVCDGTVGPGATNLVSGLAESLNSSTPVLAIVSELLSDTIHLAKWGTASQGIDQVELLKPVSKMVLPVREAHELPYSLARAMRAAESGRPGPVSLIIPQDVLDCDDIEARIGHPDPSWTPSAKTMADPRLVERAQELLAVSQRPVIVAGGGALLAGAMDELRELAELVGAPVATTWTGKGIIADDHPLSLDVLGNTGALGIDAAVKDADVVLMVGTKSSQNSTFGWSVPTPQQKVIHIDVDPLEPGRILRTDIALLGDARMVLAQLAKTMRSTELGADRAEWAQRCRGIALAARRDLKEQVSSSATPIYPQRVVAEIGDAAGPEDILACDASFASGWGALFFPIQTAGRRCLFPRGMAGLGFGLPAAIGAAVAKPTVNVFLLAGDGGFAYSVQELAVANRHGLSVKSVVINNGSYGWIHHSYRSRYGSSLKQEVLPEMNYAEVAKGFGCDSIRVSEPDDIRPALREAASKQGSFLVEIITSAEESPNMLHAKDKANSASVADPYAART